MIDGVEIIPLRTILDERGMVRHMMKSTDPHFHGFGEIYFSVIFQPHLPNMYFIRN